MADSSGRPKVSKIAFLNPFLHCNLTESAELEGSLRFIAAAKNLGIEAVVVSKTEEIYDFDPDFVVTVSHQEPKLTHYPTYGSLAAPISWVKNTPRFLRNILSYDGHIVVSPVMHSWINQICIKINKVPHITYAGLSVPKTDYKPLNLENATAAYFGLNVESSKYRDLFQHFLDGKHVRCFGPKRAWSKYPDSLYGGSVPFDGVSTLQTYAAHGAGLCINHPDFDGEGVPTNRMFEIAASSAIAICGNNSYTKNHYGDSALYLEKTSNIKELAESIKEKVNWVRSHPQQAQEMAKNAHDIFSRQLSMEFFLENILKMHADIVEENKYLKFSPTAEVAEKQSKITYLIPVDNADTIGNLVTDIQNQTYGKTNILLLTDQEPKLLEQSLGDKFADNINILSYTGKNNNKDLLQKLSDLKTEWLGILKNDDRIFPNHTALLMKQYSNSGHDKSNESTVVMFANSLEHSVEANLKDKIQDDSLLYLMSKVRIGNLTPCCEIPLCGVLFKLTQPMLTVFRNTDFSTDLRVDYASAMIPLDVALHVNEVTCSSSIYPANGKMKSSILWVKNAVYPLNMNVFNNFTTVQGKLLVEERQELVEA